VRTIRCSCCALDQAVFTDVDAGPVVCAQCAWHRNDSPHAAILAETEHVRMIRLALLDAQDTADLARGERDFYRDQLNQSYADLQLLTAALLLVDERHHYRGEECSCGDPRCSVVEVLADPKIARLIGTYDEHRHVLRELRAANPGDAAGVWADIDVTLVYPRGDAAITEPVGIGRHRAAS
jgi:hypothetical protein